MLLQILSFLLEIAVSVVGAACLVRAWMQHERMPLAAPPVGPLVSALTDWLVRPLHRLIPPAGRWDAASLLGVWLLKLAQFALLLGLAGSGRWAMLPVAALLGAFQLAVSVATALVILLAILSWVQPGSPAMRLLERLTNPLLTPLRRWLPLIGGVDLSPLLAVVLLQVVGMVLGGWQAGLLRGSLGV